MLLQTAVSAPAVPSSPSCPVPSPCLLLLRAGHLERATETNTHIYQISMPQGLQNELHSACPLPVPAAAAALPNPLLHCSCPKCLAALAGVGWEQEARGRRQEAVTKTQPQCKAADKVFAPAPAAFRRLPSFRNLASKCGVAWLGNHLVGWLPSSIG